MRYSGERNSSFLWMIPFQRFFNEHSSRSLATILSGAPYYQFISAAQECMIVKATSKSRVYNFWLSQLLLKSLKNTSLIWTLQRHSHEQNQFRLRTQHFRKNQFSTLLIRWTCNPSESLSWTRWQGLFQGKTLIPFLSGRLTKDSQKAQLGASRWSKTEPWWRFRCKFPVQFWD